MKHLSYVVILLIAPMLSFLSPNETSAAGVVGAGTPDSCTEAALNAALAGGGSVTFDCGTSPVTITVTAMVTITAGEGVPATSMDGGGLVNITSSDCVPNPIGFGCHPVRAFFVPVGGNLVVSNLSFNGEAISNYGEASVTNSAFSGKPRFGAITNSGTLSVTNSTFTRNVPRDDGGISGRAIYNQGIRVGGSVRGPGKLTVTNCTFSGNSTNDLGGGAILNVGGKVTVSNSAFTGNSADAGDGRWTYGGAIASTNRGKLTVSNSIFAANTASASGGAISNAGLSWTGARPRNGRLTVTNSTFFDNACTGDGCWGGAIDNAGPLEVTNCTFSNNSVSINNGQGGAIAHGPSGRATIRNTIFAASRGAGNCHSPYGHLKDGGHNLDAGATCGFTAAGSLSNTDPQLDPAGLVDNGGPTQTIAVQAGSPAINAGDAAVCKKVLNNLDQRGYVRPGTGATACTIGAYEFNSPGPPSTPTS
jgi:hypothetical protein